jgi:hypothetical protein
MAREGCKTAGGEHNGLEEKASVETTAVLVLRVLTNMFLWGFKL